MARSALRKRKLLLGLVLATLAGGAVLFWLARSTLCRWYCVRQLARAGAADRDAWVDRVACLGEPAVADLLNLLAHPNPQVCGNGQAALSRIGVGWRPADARTTEVVRRLARIFAHLSPAGQRCALELPTGWLSGARDSAAEKSGIVPACARLLGSAEGVADPAVQGAALGLAAALLAHPQRAEALNAARASARAGLGSAEPANRLLAVGLTLHPGIDLLDRVAPLLNDPNVEVRRTALLAVGPAEQVVPDEGLLGCLHDPDAEVRNLAEAALRGRGLRPEHIELGRLLTDSAPAQRLRVLDDYHRITDLDPGLWLRRLSQDTSPAVRAAALREMSRHTDLDLNDRIEQMVRDDPSPTVCELARFYLRERSGRRSP
jgi:hypothetical protein